MKDGPKILQSCRNGGFYAVFCVAIAFLAVMLSSQVHAQRPDASITSNWRNRTLAITGNTIRLDTLTIVPGTLTIVGIAPSAYNLDAINATLTWTQKPATDSIHVRYRVLPIAFTRRYQHKDKRLIDSLIAFRYVGAPGSDGSSSFVDFNPLEYNGSYGRSISLGNNQDVALNSHFNLQASGYLPDSIRLEAAISDNTLPFQPEGNTQRLQEFDQVYIRLTKNRHQLQLGDYNIDKPKGYFLNFNKRVQGIYYGSGFKLSNKADNSFGLSGSVAKGEFSRNIFNGTEGNQGPYKLTGNNGEQFFIVLAGTEKVYINGLLQERGDNADYVINYNTGEIRFMPRRLITKDSRIQVEFEYQSRTYLNSLVYAWDDLQIGKKWNMHLNIYSNQDAKNQGYQQSLNGEQKRFLGTIGDSISNAYYPVIALDTFSSSKILYKLVDTTVAGVHYDSVFVYSISPDSARYTLSFSNVGPGRGDYIISSRATNGRVYDWVPRAGGKPQGDYAPVQLLITPKLQQVFTLNSSYQIDSFKSLSVEAAASRYDPNLFSTIDDQSHLGMATKLHYTELRNLGRKDSLHVSKWHWQNDADYEFVQDRFRAIAPYRNVEFNRDWNIPQTVDNKPDEHLAGYATSLRNKWLGTAGYAFNYYGRGNTYTGYRNVLSYALDNKRWRTGFNLSLLQATDTFQYSRFFRPTAYAEYRSKHLYNSVVGVMFQQENNSIRDKATDTLRADGFINTISSAYLRTPDAQPLRYSLTYTYRTDQLVRANAFRLQSHSSTIDMRIGISKSKNHLIAFTGSYRRLQVDDTLFNNQKAEETGLGRLEYTGNLLKGAIQIQTLYEAGAGQEQKRTYTYVEVPAGQGIYTWVDYNGNGVQEANEFEVALYPDQKKFIRIFTPTNEYVRVDYVNFNQSLTLEPQAFFDYKAKKGWQKFVSRFADQGSLQITNRLTNTTGLEAINPFIPALRDDRIIIAATSLSNTAFFNRSSTTWGLDYTYVHSTSKSLLTYGVEGISNSQHAARLRWNLNQSFNANLIARTGQRGYQSALSDGRTYSVDNYSGEPSLTWMYHSMLRVTGTFRYEDRKNMPEYGGEHALIQRTDLEFRYTRPITGILIARGSYAAISYDGVLTSPVTFSILDALQPGSNYLWYASWERRVSKGIELSVEYEGRKPGIGTTVHTGRMTVRAIL